MSTNELFMEQPGPAQPKRVVELEIKMPRLEEIQLPKVNVPKVDMEPVRSAAEQVLLTGIGLGVLAARGVMAAARAAHKAGAEAAQHPGPVTKALLGLVQRPATHEAAGPIRRQVPVLPIDNYDALDADEVTVRLPDLTNEQLRIIRAYEEQRRARPEVLQAIDRMLGVL